MSGKPKTGIIVVSPRKEIDSRLGADLEGMGYCPIVRLETVVAATGLIDRDGGFGNVLVSSEVTDSTNIRIAAASFSGVTWGLLCVSEDEKRAFATRVKTNPLVQALVPGYPILRDQEDVMDFLFAPPGARGVRRLMVDPEMGNGLADILWAGAIRAGWNGVTEWGKKVEDSLRRVFVVSEAARLFGLGLRNYEHLDFGNAMTWMKDVNRLYCSSVVLSIPEVAREAIDRIALARALRLLAVV